MDLDVAFSVMEAPAEVRKAISRRLWKQITREDVTAVLTLNPDITNIITQPSDSDGLPQSADANQRANVTIATSCYVEPPLVARFPTVLVFLPVSLTGKFSTV